MTQSPLITDMPFENDLKLNLQLSNNYGSSHSSLFPNLEQTNDCQFTSHAVSPILEIQRHHSNHAITHNYSDLGELLTHFGSLPTHTQQNVRAIADKQKLKPRDFQYNGYYPQTALVSMLESTLARSVCFCGLKPGKAVRSPGLCHKRNLCWKCADWEARKSLKAFKPVFNSHSWGFLTISFHGDLPYSLTESPTQWINYWNASFHGLKNLYKTGHIGGAISREEIKINSIAPIRILPHLHAIVSEQDITEAVMDELQFDVHSYLEALEPDSSLVPSIDFKPIPTEKDFETVWHYIYKPTNLYEAYETQWRDDATPSEKEALNSSIYDTINAVIQIPHGRRQINYVGHMRSNNRDFIGISQN